MKEMSTTTGGPYTREDHVTRNSRVLQGLVKRGKLGTCDNQSCEREER